jgi:Family of unknown function (DUF6401)
MPDKSSTPSSAGLSAVSLRLAGEVGQSTLNRIAAGHPALSADLDQHVAAVRAAIAEYPMAGGRRNAAIAGRAAIDARVGAAGHQGLGELLSAMARSCPDVPHACDVRGSDEAVPLELLLHYVCGFLEEAVTRDWWPADEDDQDENADPDWESMRVAAVLQLISQAEAAAELPTQPLSDAALIPRRLHVSMSAAPGGAAVPVRTTDLRGGDGHAGDPVP